MRMLITAIIVCLGCLFLDKVQANSCAFCKEEVMENQWVLKTKYFRVLLDYAPQVRGHLLVVPQRHIMKAHELIKEEWEELSLIIPKIVKIYSSFLNTDEYIILEKNGPKAFQQVPHVHFHLFPVTTQKWADIFDVKVKQLSQEELANEVALFRSYFVD